MVEHETAEPRLRPRGLPMIAFPFGATVYLKLREERVPGMVTGYGIRPGLVSYRVCWSNTGCEIEHYEMELTPDYEPFIQ